VATKIKLQRLGKMREPHYRIVVADSRTKRDGRVIEAIGQYHPKDEPSTIIVDPERVSHWLSVGAQPTDPVLALLKVTGDWQKFKGLPAPEPMKIAAPKVDRKEVFQAAAREAAGLEEKPATTPKKKTKPAAEGGDETPAAEQ
jgi:small subunit ribosomal protein S16